MLPAISGEGTAHIIASGKLALAIATDVALVTGMRFDQFARVFGGAHADGSLGAPEMVVPPLPHATTGDKQGRRPHRREELATFSTSPMTPVFILQTWLLGILSAGLIAGVVYAAREWQHRSWIWDPVHQQSIFSPSLGWNEDTAILVAAVALALIVLFGAAIIKTIAKISLKSAGGEARPQPPAPAAIHKIKRPDGSILHVECFGPEDGTPIILTHGWTLNGNAWKYFLRLMAGRFRLIVWDEPGLGRSTRPANRDYSLENLAGDLQAVLALAKGRPAVLLGHSIGGMITLTFSRLFPQELGGRVMALVLTHTTPTDPVRTTKGAALYTVLEKPVLVPLMYLTIALSPLFWLLNWLSYLNGSAHLSVMRGSFAGTETWEQVEFAARFQLHASPAVVARGMLGMMRYDASGVLHRINVPTLVVAGDRDTTTMPQASDWMEARIPNCQRVTLGPARHLGHMEHNEFYCTSVRLFVEECGREASSVPASSDGRLL